MIYLDYNATTPVEDVVFDAMRPMFSDTFANASSAHDSGRAASRKVDEARAIVGEAFGQPASRVAFTSGSTESLNLAVKGLELQDRRTLLVGATEHKAALQAASDRHDALTKVIPVQGNGALDLRALEDLLDDDVALVVVMAVNNETGVINPLEDVVELAHENGAHVLCDATQAPGRIPLEQLGAADMICISAHKIYGPKGIGALVASRTVQRALTPLLSGGGQERGLRSGTLNTPGIVGLGAALKLALHDREQESVRQARLRDQMHSELVQRIHGVAVTGANAPRVCNTLNLRFDGVDGEALIANLELVQASVGSACHSAVPEPSHVLTAMGCTPAEAFKAVRFSLGRGTSEEDIRRAVADIEAAVARVRALEAA
jgi:cysteine desulfurase